MSCLLRPVSEQIRLPLSDVWSVPAAGVFDDFLAGRGRLPHSGEAAPVHGGLGMVSDEAHCDVLQSFTLLGGQRWECPSFCSLIALLAHRLQLILHAPF